jgi:YVTN family beta-propeller protein
MRLIIVAMPGLFGVAQAVDASAATPYRVIDRISAPDARWDYASVDPKRRLLFVGRIGGVMVVNLSTRKVTPVLVASKLVHGIASIGDSGTAAATNGIANTVSIFDEQTGRVLATIAVGKEPDAVIFEPETGLLFVTNEGSQSATLIDPVTFVVIDTLSLGGKPEFPAADGKGFIYDNIQDKNEIAVIDVAGREIVRRIALPGCESPTGLAYDEADSLLLSVCLNGVALFVDAQSGNVRRSFKVGAKADAAIFDLRTHRAFVPSGADGALNIFAVRGSEDIALEQILPTQSGTRTAALDPLTGRLYLPAGRLVHPTASGGMPTLVRNSFRVLVVAPMNERSPTIRTYTKKAGPQ